MNFFLGTHMPGWLSKIAYPLFVSRRRLMGRKRLPVRIDNAPWALDSGGFSELSLYDRWKTTPAEYATEVRRFRDEIGGMMWAAPQDWMCEPQMLAKTGLTIREHQIRTVASVAELRGMGCPVIPVLQGWSLGDYFQCWELYEQGGFDLRTEPIVGLGSVCRRQAMTEAAVIVHALRDAGLKIHGFGFKMTGLRACGDSLESSDSLAWSFAARKRPVLAECVGKHKTCANCASFALKWRADLLQKTQTNEAQMSLFFNQR